MKSTILRRITTKRLKCCFIVSQLLLAAAAQPPLPPHGLTTTPSFSSSSIAATEEMMAEDHRKQLVRRLLRMPADLRPGYDTAEHPTEPREGKEEDGGDEDGEQPARASSGFIASLWDTRDRVMHEQAGQQNQNPQVFLFKLMNNEIGVKN
jgi:hypothetical protein